MFREDIYQLLKINDYVPAEFVKKAFREFAKENHPDLYPGNTLKEERFKMVTSAYRKWKTVQETVKHIRRIKNMSYGINSTEFKPWTFSCTA
jgi:molecular chaperone DnaJ